MPLGDLRVLAPVNSKNDSTDGKKKEKKRHIPISVSFLSVH